jgi:hypothetical protein
VLSIRLDTKEDTVNLKNRCKFEEEATFKMTTSNLIAPCGMNCGICLGYLRTKNHCVGCCSEDENKPSYCNVCVIKNCESLNRSESKFCYECSKYPCRRLKQLDKRYRTRYGMSMIENLEFIKVNGLEKFEEKENRRWICPNCGAVLCVHREFCLTCKAQYREKSFL